MSPGGEPERDDTGLPPVDIEIPDDARELDRDVQAYYRELRALQRGRRRARWHRVLRRDGVVLPMLACLLILALVSGTLLTVFTATSAQSRLRPRPATVSPGASRPEITARAPQLAAATGPLPAATLRVGPAQVRTSTLAEAMLIIVPAGCGCASAVAWLAGAASQAKASAAYLLYTPQTRAAVTALAGQLPAQARGSLRLAGTTGTALTGAVPARLAGGGLAAILISKDRAVTYAGGLSAGEPAAPVVMALTR